MEFNKQEVFDKVKAHLLAQMATSVTTRADAPGGEMCAYRGKNGTKCALGTLIPDDKYDPSLEGCGPYDNNVIVAMGYEPSDLLGSDRKFLIKLQEIHDCHRPSEWAEELKLLASGTGLTP
jgi:hypothetical protein